jgi:hypothetical protein
MSKEEGLEGSNEYLAVLPSDTFTEPMAVMAKVPRELFDQSGIPKRPYPVHLLHGGYAAFTFATVMTAKRFVDPAVCAVGRTYSLNRKWSFRHVPRAGYFFCRSHSLSCRIFHIIKEDIRNQGC